MNTGIAQFFYTRQLPAGAVALAQVVADPSYAADLMDSLNVSTTGTLGVWRFSTDGVGPVDVLSAPPTWSATALGSVITILGANTYIFDSQFFEMTNIKSQDGTALFYQQNLDSQANSITITDDTGVVITTETLITGGVLYHSLDGALYWIRYVDSNGILQKVLLKYNPVLARQSNFPSSQGYALAGRQVLTSTILPLYVRFTQYSIFGVSIPYGNLPNIPWFPRIRFPLTSFVPEWAAQSFNPGQPYLLASWVTGHVINANVLQLSRSDIYPDANHWPDVIVFDKNYNVKYALEGTSTVEASRRGTAYPWKRGQIVDVDFHTGFVNILPNLASDDIIFGFYSYVERDVVLTAIDCNPFTNPSILNCVIRFYFRANSDPFRRLFYQVINSAGADVALASNDPFPIAGQWTNNPNIVQIGDLFIGASISPQKIKITDARVRGGGLVLAAQGIDQASNFWDIGFLDGKPYPIGGTLAVYLPAAILNTMSRSEVQQRVSKTMPLGSLAVIRYYEPDGTEIV